MWRARRPGAAEQLSHHWDACGSDRPDTASPAADLDPTLIATITWLHAHDDARAPDPAYLNRLETTLMDTIALAPGLAPLDATAPPALNGRATPGLQPVWPSTAPEWRLRRRRILTSFATAA